MKVAWWMSQSYIVLCERGKPSILGFTPGTLPCDYCNTNCGRGVHGAAPNECNLYKKQAKAKKKIEK
jgi:hypothetical protein